MAGDGLTSGVIGDIVSKRNLFNMLDIWGCQS